MFQKMLIPVNLIIKVRISEESRWPFLLSTFLRNYNTGNTKKLLIKVRSGSSNLKFFKT